MGYKKLISNILFLSTLSIFVCTLLPFTSVTPEARAALSKRVYLTSGTVWTVPADWSNVNTVEAIGGGGTGGSSVAGGGGGAYALASNISLTPGGSANYQIGSAGSDTVFNSTATTCGGSPTPSVCADGGVNGVTSTNGTGGTAAGSVGTTKYSGGNGGGGSGGGAAGPYGAGGNGTSDRGGTGGNGFGGGGGYAGTYEAEPPPFCAGPGQAGSAGSEFSTAPARGSGGGGGFGPFTCTSGAGGAYGGGGGGDPAAAGGSGLIVITYTSTDAGSTSIARFKIKGGSFIIRGGSVRIR